MKRLPISEEKSQWAYAHIEKKDENLTRFIIKFFPDLEFQGIHPQEVANEYMNYYEEKTRKIYLIDGYEVFGVLSSIVWKIWSSFYEERILKFVSVIRLTQKNKLFDNITSEDHSGTVNSSVNLGEMSDILKFEEEDEE